MASDTSSSERRSLLVRAFRVVVALTAFGFVAWTLSDLIGRASFRAVSVSWWLALASGLPLVAAGLLQAWGWALLLSRMTHTSIRTGPAIALHVESMLARYVPGKVGLPLVRMAGAASIGSAPTVVGVSVVVEMLSFQTVGGLMGFGVLALSRARGWQSNSALGTWVFVLLGAFAVGLLGLLVVDRRRIPEVILKKLGISGEGPIVPPVLPLVHALSWAGWIAHGYLALRSVGADGAQALSGSGYFPVAIVAGFLALVAPAGAGVREAVLSGGIAPIVGATGALAAAAVSRVGTLVIELAVFVLTRPLAVSREPPA